jgi:hypothetical protein
VLGAMMVYLIGFLFAGRPRSTGRHHLAGTLGDRLLQPMLQVNDRRNRQTAS